jgi:hypothetical protein
VPQCINSPIKKKSYSVPMRAEWLGGTSIKAR